MQEGFQATLAGSENGKVYGAGINFARDSSLAHKYAVNSARRSQSGNPEQEPLRVFLSRIVTGVYTGVPSTLNLKPDVPHCPGACRVSTLRPYLMHFHTQGACLCVAHVHRTLTRGLMCIAQTERLA